MVSDLLEMRGLTQHLTQQKNPESLRGLQGVMIFRYPTLPQARGPSAPIIIKTEIIKTEIIQPDAPETGAFF